MIMAKERRDQFGDEAPRWKELIIVLVAALLLIAFAWISWFKFGWFH
jgi:hypothetical protein